MKRSDDKKRHMDEDRREPANVAMEGQQQKGADDYCEALIQCFLCHQRNAHESKDCPNADCEIQFLNRKFEDFKAQNDEEDRANPQKKYRIK